ncbi:hypothetical protein EV426DRAFT_591701 [Tirmania nivea]|nr:hypothetical protein EV426DRAFT_591701 [Tirmania nivea]
MVAMEAIFSANRAFKGTPEANGLVALFVGATSGIALHTLKSFATHTNSPTIYFTGRSTTAANSLISETLKINPTANITFIPTPDLTSLAGHDSLVDEFLKKETKLDVLVMSAGYLTLKGRDENEEGLDRKMTINYYGRMRLLLGLLPSLRAAARERGEGGFKPSVLSILAAGREGAEITRKLIDEGNLDLAKPGTFGPRNCEKVIMSSSSLALEELSLREKNMRFAHVYPGIVVDTGIMREFPPILRGVWGVFRPVVGMMVGVKGEDVGEGMFSLLHSGGKEGGNLFLGQWDGEGRDFRKAKVVGCNSQEEWEKERGSLRQEVWAWLGQVMGRVGSERINGLGLWSAEQ